jgi:DNA-binding MarR family transcriptional regulator
MSGQLTLDALLAELPVTPYAGTGGWSGTETSKARAEDDKKSGRLSQRQQDVLRALYDQPEGLIWSEIADALRLHHGQASGALSNLHKAGLVFQLVTPRDKCLPYVHSRYKHLHDQRRDKPTTNKRGISSKNQHMINLALQELVAIFGESVLHTDAYKNLKSLTQEGKQA